MLGLAWPEWVFGSLDQLALSLVPTNLEHHVT